METGTAPTTPGLSSGPEWVDRRGPRPFLRLLLLGAPVVPIFAGVLFYLAAASFNSVADANISPATWAVIGAVVFLGVGLPLDVWFANRFEIRRARATDEGVDLQFYSLIGRPRTVHVAWSALVPPAGLLRGGGRSLAYRQSNDQGIGRVWLSREQFEAVARNPHQPGWLVPLS